KKRQHPNDGKRAGVASPAVVGGGAHSDRGRSHPRVLPFLHPEGVALSSPGHRPGKRGHRPGRPERAQESDALSGLGVVPAAPQGDALGWTIPPLRGEETAAPQRRIESSPSDTPNRKPLEVGPSQG